MAPWLFFWTILVTLPFCLATPAEAWGAGMHVAQGSFVLNNLSLIRPEIAATLAASPLDYIYGCISADIFMGKGYHRRDDHCHNWSIGQKVLHAANDTGSTRAFAYGYLSHLAADVIAHNYLIPNLLYKTPASKKLGHVYWEYRADRFIHKRFWRLASEVVLRHNQKNDELMRRVMKRSALRFGVKKLVYKRAVRLSDITRLREAVAASYNGTRPLTKKDVATLNNYSINLILDLLLYGEESLGYLFDPVGTDNTIESKRLRSSHKLRRNHDRNRVMFPVASKIVALNHIDHETERF